MCRADLCFDCRPREQRGRPVRLGHRVVPFPVQLHQLRTPNQTLATEGRNVWMGGAPAAQGIRPLLRAIDVEHVVARADHAAVDHTRDHRNDLAARDGEHDFVQQGEAFSASIHPQQHARLCVARERGDVDVGELRSHAIGLLEDAERRREITFDDLHVALRAQEQPVLNALLASVVEQSLRAREPTIALGLLRRHADQRIAKPEGAARRANEVAAFDENRHAHGRARRWRWTLRRRDTPPWRGYPDPQA